MASVHFRSRQCARASYLGGATLDGQADFYDDPDEEDVYLGYYNTTSFECTRAFVKNLVTNNSLPKKASPPANWPSECILFEGKLQAEG